jgi:L-asparaginase
MQNMTSTVVVLGTGGTLAGTSSSAADHTGYTAGQIEVGQLLAAVPLLAGWPLECEQVAQVDSKDMDFAIWLRLARRVAWHLDRPEVGGIVVTHGTDTLEETAYFLQRVLAPRKPVVLTAAMRPATALQADGPQNLVDACCVVRSSGVHGVVAVLAGGVHSARDVRKVHPYQVDAFSSGDAGLLAWVEDGVLRCLRPWPDDEALGLDVLWPDAATWPAVEIVTSHVGARGAVVDALCASGARGLVVAATGNGTLHHALEQALRRAQAQGVKVVRATRCLNGSLVGPHQGTADALPSAGDLTPVKARVELLLDLMRSPSTV